MSWISNSFDVDKLHNQNPFTRPQEEDEVLPFLLNFPSPLLDENLLFSAALAADESQKDNLGWISNIPLPRVNIDMNAAQEISTNTPSAGTHLHQHPSMPNYYSAEMKKSTFNKGSTARRSGKKDRRTKINTSKGPRERRMRLSLQIARKFFDLQDMLGFDKASKTIDWLFSKSKKAIKQLSGSASHVTQMNNNNICQKGSKSVEILEEKRKVKTTLEGHCVSGTKKNPKSVTSRSTKHNAKEFRDKARARARERTREKKMIRSLEKSKCIVSDQAYNFAELGPAGNPNPLFEIGQESMSNSSSQDNVSTSQSSLQRHLANMELLGATASPSGSVTCSMYGYPERNGDFFSGGLDSYSNNLCYLGWDISSECSNPNSINFLKNSGYNFQYFDQNQVD